MSQEEKIRIIDRRQNKKFMVDDEFIDSYARYCGIYATGVYMSLCRHVNKEQRCFPGEALIAEELGIAVKSVRKGIRNLEKMKMIRVLKKPARRNDGTWKRNEYVLLDKSGWRFKAGGESQEDV